MSKVDVRVVLFLPTNVLSQWHLQFDLQSLAITLTDHVYTKLNHHGYQYSMYQWLQHLHLMARPSKQIHFQVQVYDHAPDIRECNLESLPGDFFESHPDLSRCLQKTVDSLAQEFFRYFLSRSHNSNNHYLCYTK